MNIWLTDKEKTQTDGAGRCQYVFELPPNGRFSLHVWLHCQGDPGQVAVELNGSRLFDERAVSEGDGHWRCGVLGLEHGRHQLAVHAAVPVDRILLSEDADAVRAGRAQLLWENRRGDAVGSDGLKKLTDQQRSLLIRHGFLFEQERDAERCQVPSGVPLGGIGAGKVELTPRGYLTALTINNNQDCPIYRMPGSFFAIGLTQDSKSVARLLQTQAVDQRLTPVQSIEAELAFPEARLKYRDPALPLEIDLHAFSPHVPHDVTASSLPCVLLRFSLRHAIDGDPCPLYDPPTLTVRLMFSWESLINVGGDMLLTNLNEDSLLPLVRHTANHAFAWSNRSRNYQYPRHVAGGTALVFAAKDDQGNPNSFGEHAIWTPQPAQLAPDRDLVEDEAAFAEWFSEGGERPFRPRGNGIFRAGALIVEQTLKAGQSTEVDFILAWHMPHWQDKARNDDSVFYARQFKDVCQVVEHAWTHRRKLLEGTQQVRNILEASDLPDWFARQLLDSRFVANTNTVLDRQGRFAVNQSPTAMRNCRGALDQRTCGGSIWTTFFPELDAAELGMLSRCHGDDGMPARDAGLGAFEIGPRGQPWPDLAAAYVVQAHRHYLATGEGDFLHRHWPAVKRVMEWAVAEDATGDGVPTLRAGRGTTYDGEPPNGIGSFAAGMHQAGLILAADLAARSGDSGTAERYLTLAQKANHSRMKYLWVEQEQGAYFRSAFDPAGGRGDDSCFLSSFAGDWAVSAAGFRSWLPQEAIRQGLRSIRRLNMDVRGVSDQSAAREAMTAGQAKLISPDSSQVQYAVAYFAAMAVYAGLDDLAWEFLRKLDGIVTRAPSSHYNQTATYSGLGQPGGLPYNMTAPASWLFLNALSGVVADVSEKHLRLSPHWFGEKDSVRVPVFTTSSWFMLTSARSAECLDLWLQPLQMWRLMPVTRLMLMLPDDPPLNSASVNGKKVRMLIRDEGLVELPVDFDPGRDRLEIQLQ